MRPEKDGDRNDIANFIKDIDSSLNRGDPRQELKLASMRTHYRMIELEDDIASLNNAIRVIGRIRNLYKRVSDAESRE
ncbi:MAG: hypothetical protein ACR2O4_14455 [Hyphomicrobiaceae bacterium]